MHVLLPDVALPVLPGKACSFKYPSLIALLLIVLSGHLSAQQDLAEASLFATAGLEKTRLRQTDSAEYYINRSLTFFQDNDDLADWLMLHRRLGMLFRYDLDHPLPEQAMTWYDHALSQAWRKPASEEEWVSWAFLHLGRGYVCSENRADYVCARQYYEIGRTILQDTLHHEDTMLADVVLRPLGNIHARFRDFEKAYRLLREGEKICETQRAWDKAAFTINGMGMIALTKEDYGTAATFFRQGVALPALNPHARVTLLINLGLAELKKGNVQLADSLTRASRQILQQYPKAYTRSDSLEHWADLNDNLGNIALVRGQWREAARFFQQHIDLYTLKFNNPNRREIAQGYLELCSLYTDWGYPDSTLHYAQSALRCLYPDLPPGDDLVNPPRQALYSEHTLYLAFEQKIAALEALSKRYPADQNLLRRCIETADLLFATDDLLRREYAFEDSKLYRQQVNRHNVETTLFALFRLEQLSGNPAWTQRAWQYADQARDRLFVELVQVQAAIDRAPAALRQEMIHLQQQRMEWEQQRFNLRQRGATNSDSLDALVFENQLGWRALLDSMERSGAAPAARLPLADLVAVQTMLQPDQALLEYFYGDSALYYFTITPTDARMIRTAKPPWLGTAIHDLSEAITRDSLQAITEDVDVFSRAAGQLYDGLLAEPLAALPPSISSLIIIPDDTLCIVPFEVLGKGRAAAGFKSFPYLIRRYTVSYAPSASLLLQTIRLPQTNQLETFAGFAPSYPPSDTLDPSISMIRTRLVRDGKYELPGAQQEVKEIAALLKGTAFFGPEAGESQFKHQARRFRILHLAMHAMLNEQDPMFSKLLFTHGASGAPGEKPEDNDLNAIELYNMQLPADLVVLSACNTGNGKLQPGEGVMSLARAFTFAGVSATVMSLWQASDNTTPQLMQDFYQNLKTGMRKDEALRQAKLHYLEHCTADVSNPFYWAAFVGTGDMRALWK